MSARPVPITPPPGVVKTETARVLEGRFSDADKIRFDNGRAQKIGGWTKLTSEPTSGMPRAAHAWYDLETISRIALGTYRKLYILDGQAFDLNDVTPLADEGDLTDPFTTVDGSATVTVAHTAHGRNEGDTVIFSNASAVGGITIDGAYTVSLVPGANSYEIIHSAPATSDVSGGGGTVDYLYEVGVGVENGAYGLGYGVGGYGLGTYGTERDASTVFVEPRIWSLDNWGQILLAAYNGGTIYAWEPDQSYPRAEVIDEAPDDVRYMFVTPERYVIALCADMTIKWCSQSEYETWTPAQGNTAGSRRVMIGTKLIAGAPVGPGYSLIWSDGAAYVHQWTGSALVFDTRLAGSGCGLISPSAFVTANNVAYWMGHDSFWLYAGGLMPIPNVDDIKKYVFDTLRTDFAFKCCAMYVPRFNEVWWFYANEDQDEPGLYVIFDIDTQVWSVGTLSRVSGTYLSHGDTRPFWAGSDGHLYRHEDGHDDDESPMEAFLELAPVAISEGDQNMDIFGFVADFHEQSGEVEVTIKAWDRLRNGVLDQQEKSIAEDETLVDYRVSGRYVGLTIRSNTLGGHFRFGKPSALTKATSRRR